MSAISKRLRFEVLKRDGHRCHYCGVTAAEAKIVVDAVVPEALGGSHKDPANLVAACDPCNNGKTSSSPDAPLVAAVAEDAARWARAMTVATEKMRAELAGHIEIHEKFDRQWSDWTYGTAKLPIPRPDDWRQSVDTFLAAGLPMDVLQWCVQQAMTRKQVKAAGTWRYMCGIAWSKVTELQASAQVFASGAEDAREREWCEFSPQEQSLISAAREELACELLGEFPENARNAALATTREHLGEDVGELEVCTVFAEFHSALRERRQFAKAARWFVDRHPDGPESLSKARAHLEGLGSAYDEMEATRVAALWLTGAANPAAAVA